MAPTSTADRIQAHALELFAHHGFDEVTVEEVARAAGVSHMTFFRHFPTKESVVLADPWDPVIAQAVAAQPVDRSPLERVCGGLLDAVAHMGDALDDESRLRVRLTAGHPRLRAAMWEHNDRTADAMVGALVDTGVHDFDARVAVGAALGAVMAALLDWGQRSGHGSLRACLERALHPLADAAAAGAGATDGAGGAS